MTRPVHTPYDGSATPFTIGLKPFDVNDWIEPEDDLETYLAEKERLFASVPERVFMARSDTVAAQGEVLDALVHYLPDRFPAAYRREAAELVIGDGRRRVRLDPDDPAPLRTASMLVPEDLVLMRKFDDGWRLVAASLCFPSSWSLAEKFDRPLQIIHTTVPAFGPGTRTAGLIERIFDSLKVELPVERMNWSLQENADLYHPRSKNQRDEATEGQGGFLAGQPVETVYLRVERQTLRKMPVSGDILFTIRIHLDPLSVLPRHPGGQDLASGLEKQLAALNAKQLAYKGLAEGRERLVGWLREQASG
ncbi:heme-dependent oxidative N-demethylase family protein [Oricola indica]|uniref:heme-dependent oxidative N-demethylase family protein n=1 Tax=Oricola indica TaxID=2872591 RepID=UPI003CCBC334